MRDLPPELPIATAKPGGAPASNNLHLKSEKSQTVEVSAKDF